MAMQVVHHNLWQDVQPLERHRITRWAKGVWAGAVAGALFLAVAMFLTEAMHRGEMWQPLRLSAAIALGDRAVAAAGPVTSDIITVGLLIHMVVSIWYATVLGMIIRKLSTAESLTVGALFGLALYFVHFYGLTTLYPWVANARSGTLIIAHVVYGLAAAWSYSQLHVNQLLHEHGLETPGVVD